MRIRLFRTHSPRGVTMIELMVVVALLGIVAAFVSPTVSRVMQRNKIDEVGRVFANQLRATQQFALTHNEAVIFWMQPFDSGGNQANTVTTERMWNTPQACQVDADCDNTGGGQRGTICAYNPTTGQGECRQARTCRDFNFMVSGNPSTANQGTAVNLTAMGVEIIGGSAEQIPICFGSDGRVMGPSGNGPASITNHSCGDEAVFVVGVASMTQGQINSTHSALLCNCGRPGAGPDLDCQIERENLGLVRIEMSPRGAVAVR